MAQPLKRLPGVARLPAILLAVLLAVLLAGWLRPGLPEGQAQGGIQVVRVWFQQRAELDAITAWLEPWEVHHDQGYLVAQVDTAGLERLRGMGLRVETDQRLTQLANPPAVQRPHSGDSIPGFTCYRSVTETLSAAQTIAMEYPGLAEWVDMGDSWEKATMGGNAGHDMRVLRLTNRSLPGPKPPVFIIAAIHARELVTAELLTRFAEQMVQGYGIDPDITWLLDQRDVHLLLQANPDGRAQIDAYPSSLWRKNTDNAYCSNTTSRGADLNRNFSFGWGCCNGSSGAVCDLTYRGASPASEPETQAIQDYARSLFPDRRGSGLNDPAPDDVQGLFLDLHSYGGLVLWPWGFSASPAPNAVALQTLGRKFAYFNHYTPQAAYALYTTDGTTDDFVYGELGAPAYTFEMGNWFLQDCPTFESSILPDNLAALHYAIKAAAAPYRMPKGPDISDLSVSPLGPQPGALVMVSAWADDRRTTTGEAVQNIQAAAFSIDEPLWMTGTLPTLHPMQAVDGVFDQRMEAVSATFDPSGLTTGKHLLYVYAQDELGNWGAPSAAWVEVRWTAYLPFIQK